VVDAAAAERALEALRQCLVLIGGEVGQSLDDRDLRAEAVPDRGELDADDATAEHDRARGHGVELEGLVGGDDATADLEPRKRASVRAGGENHIATGVALAVDLDGIGPNEAAAALDEGHAARVHEALEAA